MFKAEEKGEMKQLENVCHFLKNVKVIVHQYSVRLKSLNLIVKLFNE